MARITPDECRYALRTLSSIQLDDGTLNSTRFIPWAEAKIDALLAEAALTYIDMEAYQCTLICSAQIDLVCMKVINSAPKEDLFSVGPHNPKEKKEELRKGIIDTLQKSYENNLIDAGIKLKRYGFSHVGGDNFHADGKDSRNTNVKNSFSVWG